MHLEAIAAAYEGQFPLPGLLNPLDVGCIAVDGNRVLLLKQPDGLAVEAHELPDGVEAHIKVRPGAVLAQPVHLCFGSLALKGVQRLIATFDIGAGAQVEFIACCSFPNAEDLEHLMEGHITLGKGSSLVYRETHHHNGLGGVTVRARARVDVGQGARFISGLNLTDGRAGSFSITYEVDVAAGGLAELNARGLGFGDDVVNIDETIRLNGPEARGLAKSRIAVSDQASAQVVSVLEGNAPRVLGHVDCIEIVQDDAVAKAIPLLHVRDDTARLTHEAAIGTVDHKALETLLARGLDAKTAADVIVRGMLGEGLPDQRLVHGSESIAEENVAPYAIEVQELTRDYGTLRAVDRISFTVEPGEVFGFLGPNGAGKTTTLRMLTTLLEPTSGLARLNGHDIRRQSYQARRQFGVVPEESNVYRELSGRANLRFAGRLHRLPRAERERRLGELLERFGLADRADSRVETYSRGMRRKLTIAMALMHRPQILFLDEPTAGLDVQGQRAILELVNELRDEGITIFLTTHQIEEANQLCDRVAIINHGRIAAIDTPARLRQMMAASRTLELTLATEPPGALESLSALVSLSSAMRHGEHYRLAASDIADAIPEVTAWAAAQNAPILALNTITPTLEDVFVMLTEGAAAIQPVRVESDNEGPETSASPRRRRPRDCGGGRQ